MATLRQTFSDIASAIRAKGVSGTMKPIEMASKIGQIQTGGGGEDYGYLTFTAEENTTLTLKRNGGIASHKLLKSTDGVNWTKWENPSTNGIVLNAGESVYIKADEDALNRTAYDEVAFNYFSSSKKIGCTGDIRSILNMVAPSNYQFWLFKLFNACKSLTQAPELQSTTLSTYCYRDMFSGCTSLTSAPELPATTLANSCYQGMFYGCTSLTTAPSVLPATTLANNCYYYMFYGCTSLTTAPELPATTLASSCYHYMFYGCTSLNKAPELPAMTLGENCCQYMFKGCTSLTKAPSILPSTRLTRVCYGDMFNGCTSLTSAPELPATGLTDWCYSSMFYNCTSLHRIKMNASYGSWGESMFYGCTSLELVDMTGSTGVPQLSNVNNFANTNDTYKIVVPDSLYDTWIAATNWVSIASHIMKQSDWNAEHPDDILGQ